MKALKNTSIVVAILVAAISIDAYAAKTEKKSNAKDRAEAAAYVELEQSLIENYLNEQQEIEDLTVKVFNDSDVLIYEGPASAIEAQALRLQADYLMEYGNTIYYRTSGS